MPTKADLRMGSLSHITKLSYLSLEMIGVIFNTIERGHVSYFIGYTRIRT